MMQSEMIDMNPVIYLHKAELERSAGIVAQLFLVIGTASIAAALIVQIRAANFQFGSAFVGTWLLPLMLLLVWFLLSPQFNAWQRSHFFFLNAGEPMAGQEDFANPVERPLVLIADKDVFMRSALDFHLTRAGFRVEHA